MLSPNEIYRVKRITESVISELNIDLTDLTILTEAGSNLFAFTPIIAAMCNAKKVIAWTKTSNHGTSQSIVTFCKKIEQLFRVPNKIKYTQNERPIEEINEADLITNLGFVRPLDRLFLGNLKPGAVVAAMCESWEVRKQDIDTNFCSKKNIPVAGTWENYPSLEIFNSCGPLAIKLSLEAGFEVIKNNILIWSNDQFGQIIAKTFHEFGAKSVITTTSTQVLYSNIKDIDYIFFCNYSEQDLLIGEAGKIDTSIIKNLNPSCGFVHLYGKIDYQYAAENALNIFPKKNGYASIMSFTLAHLGPTPIIQLHAAGLKVGECLKKNISHSLVQRIC